MMPKKALPPFLLLAFFALFPATILTPITFVSASSEEAWIQKYGENNHFRAETFVQASDGGFVIAGTIESAGLLLKTDSYGNMEWNQTYGDRYTDHAESLVETSDGGFALVSSDTQLIKFDVYGNIEWNRTVSEGNRAYSLIQTSDDGYAIAGTYGDLLHGYEHYFWLVKTDETGHNQWSKVYETIITGTASSVIQTLDGGFALLGLNNFNPDFLLVKTDSSGELEWSQQYKKRDWDTGQCIVQNSDGGYTLAGTLWNRSDHNNMAGIIKTDSNGNMLWMKNYPGSWDVSMVGTSDGGYVLCSDLRLTKTDSEGNILWTRDLDFATDNSTYLQSHSVIQTHDGGYAILGTGSFQISDDPPTGITYVWIMKTNLEGVIPEFPAWIILPLLLTSTLVAIIYRKKLHKTQTQQSY